MGASKKQNIARIRNNYAESRYYSEEAAARRRRGLVRRLTAFALLATILSYFTISSIYTRVNVLEEKRAEKKQLELKLSELEREREILDEEIIKLNDEEYISKLARKELFYSGKGEIIFSLPDDKKEK